MLIKWIKKKILKSIINDIKKDLPQFKQTWIDFIVQQKERYGDELLDFCKEKLKESFEDIIKNNIYKEN